MPRFDGEPVFSSLLGGNDAATAWDEQIEGAFEGLITRFPERRKRVT